MTINFPGFVFPTSGVQLRTMLNLLCAYRVTEKLDVTITADQEDYNETGLDEALVVEAMLDDDHSLGGIAGGAIHRTLVLVNSLNSAGDWTLKDASEDSEEGNQLDLGGSNLVLAPGQAAALPWDITTSKWKLFASEMPFPLANDPGLPGLDWRGAWLTATAYAENDGVSNGGRSYIAKSGHTSGFTTEPGVGASWATFWDLLADKGADGAMSAATYDPTAVAGDAFDQDNMADGATNKNYTAIEKTKLSGISDSADVTGTVIHAATGKTTLVDTDELGLIDSAASNALKKVTWANVKTTLKTYFDTLYQPLASALSSWANVARASGFDTFAAMPSSANLAALLTDETGSDAVVFASAIREKLVAARTYYVRTDGSDSNTGLANNSGGAFLTWQKAWNIILTLDLNGFAITVQVADGTYTGGLTIVSPPLGGNVTFQGNNSTPANVLVSTSGPCVYNSASGFILNLRDFKIASSGSVGVNGAAGAYISIGGMDFGACGNTQLRADSGSYIAVDGNYTISGNASQHWVCTMGGKINGNTKTITLTGTPAFSGGFAALETGGVLNFFAATFSGSATGSRYSISSGGIINLYGAGTSALPGNSAGSGGTTSGGGFYA